MGKFSGRENTIKLCTYLEYLNIYFLNGARYIEEGIYDLYNIYRKMGEN